MKTNSDKKVNQKIKQLNRRLAKDVFGDRFYVRQIMKSGYRDWHEYHFYIYQLCDRKYPNRNKVVCLNEGEILIRRLLDVEINNFIVESDFWQTFKSQIV